MSKYRLINSVTKEEHICDKVTIDGFDYYLSDEEIQDFDNVIDIVKRIWIKMDPCFVKAAKGQGGSKKIIATNNPNMDLPKVVDEILYKWKLGLQASRKSKTPNKSSMRNGFVKGYNKSQETYPFTKEDMVEFSKWMKENDVEKNAEQFFGFSNYDMLNFWKEQQPKIIYYG